MYRNNMKILHKTIMNMINSKIFSFKSNCYKKIKTGSKCRANIFDILLHDSL